MQKSEPFRFSPPNYKTIGHRGAGLLAPENTLNAFILAKKLGLNWVEFDTQACATGEWVLMHDDSLERCSNGQGLVSSTPFEILAQLRTGKEFSPHSFSDRIPLLSESLEILAQLDLHPNIEIKSSKPFTEKSLQDFLDIIEIHWPDSKIPPLISSFDAEILFEIKKRAPKYPLGYNIEMLEADTLDIFRKGGFSSLHCDYIQLPKEVLEALLLEPFPLLLYTVNDPILAQNYFQKGVFAIFSDSPNSIAQSFTKA